MPKVEIDTPGVTIRLEASEASVQELSGQALQLYRDASEVDAKRRESAPAFGFTADRRGEHDLGHGTQWHQPRTTS